MKLDCNTFTLPGLSSTAGLASSSFERQAKERIGELASMADRTVTDRCFTLLKRSRDNYFSTRKVRNGISLAIVNSKVYISVESNFLASYV